MIIIKLMSHLFAAFPHWLRGLSVMFESFLHRRRELNHSVFNKTLSRNSLHLPSSHVHSAYSVYGNIRNYNNNYIKLHFLGNDVEPSKLASSSISRDCNVGWKKRMHYQIAKRMGNLNMWISNFFQNSEIATFSRPGSHIYIYIQIYI